MDAASFQAELFAHVVRGSLRGFHHAAHADDGVFGVFHLVAIDHPVAAPGVLVELVHRFLHGAGDLVVEMALGDLALHVGILVLHDAGHDRVPRIEQATELVDRVAHVGFHELQLGEQDVFNRMRGEETVLHIHERRFAGFRSATGDQGEVAGFLGVAAKEHSPAAVGDTHDVVVTTVNIQRVRRERARADVEDDGQTFAGNGVEHFLHQHEALAGSEVRHATAREREAFAGRCGGVLGLRLHERDGVAPQVLFAVRHGRFVAGAHRCRGRDGISARAVCDVSIDPNDAASAVGSGGDAGVGDLFFLVAHNDFCVLRIEPFQETSRRKGCSEHDW